MFRKTIPLFVVLVLLFEGCSGLFHSGEPDGFIRVKGTHFTHNGKPYYFAGTNVWYGCYIGSSGETGDRQRLTRELDSLRSIGLVNLRVLAASEDSYIKRSVKPAIQRAPGDVDGALLEGLDFLLAEMAKRRMHAVLYLNNYWEWSGGMVQYNVWANGTPGVDPEDPAQGWPAFMRFSATFYQNEKANALYRAYVRSLITRKNTYNGRQYSEDPTIMSWQLANEPRPAPGALESKTDLDVFDRWVDQTAAYIHSLDTNHLVSTGSEGSVAFAWSADAFVQAHRTPNIDYLTFHLWPKNWGWYDPMRFNETLDSTEIKASEYLLKHFAAARELNKPLVLEEFGLARDSALCQPGSPATARDRYYAKVLGIILDSARAGAPIAGSNFWAWGGEGRGRNADNMWRKGDPFTGDPPQEPQGYNSICIGDTSTLRILRDHAFKMMQLGLADSALAARRN